MTTTPIFVWYDGTHSRGGGANVFGTMVLLFNVYMYVYLVNAMYKHMYIYMYLHVGTPWWL